MIKDTPFTTYSLWLEEFEVRSPLRELIHPHFKVTISPNHDDNVMIHLTLITQDRDGLGQTPFTMARILFGYQLSVINSKDLFFEFLRGMLRDALYHEVDESCHVGGRRVWDPHDTYARLIGHKDVTCKPPKNHTKVKG